jgi:stage V sporulation protein SpoVS
MALIGLNRDELDLSQLPKDSFYDPKKDDDLSGVQIRATITFRITNPDGTVVKEWTEPAHSLNYNFATFIWILWDATTATIVDTTGTAMSLNGASGGTMALTAPSGNSSYGIVIGSGASAGSTPSPTANNLIAQIPNGTSSGQIEYGAVSVGAVSQSGQITQFTISRSFTNVSGATITVTEIGLVVNVTGFAMVTVSTHTAVSSDYFLIAYDIPSSAISVQNGQTLTITYTFSVTT